MKLITKTFIFITSLLFLSTVSAFQLTVDSAGKLPPNVINNLIEFIPVKKQPNTFIAANSSGDIYQVNLSELNAAPKKLFSLPQALPKAEKLTALALHPSFSLRDQPGFATLFTAHIEPASSENRYLIVRDKHVDRQQISHHTVVTEWQLDSTGNIDLSTQREVIRIAIPDNRAAIRQLSFNPSTKVWNDDYGLMFITLDLVEPWQKSPLYSGAILQINPKKFGLKNYTTPQNNPFIKDNNVPAETWSYNLGNIQQISWFASRDNQLFLHHRIDTNHLFSRIPVGTKGVKKVNTLYQVEKHPQETGNSGYHQMLGYQGKLLSMLWNQLLIVQYSESGWQLNSIDSRSNQENAQMVWPFDSTEPLLLFKTHNNEPLLINTITGQLTKLINVAIPGEEELTPHSANYQQANIQQSNIVEQSVILIIFGLVLLTLIYKLTKKFIDKKNSLRYFLHQQFIKASYEPSLNQLLLYKHGQESVTQKIAISDIKAISLSLNNEPLLTICGDAGLKTAQDEAARKQIALVKKAKLDDEKQRTVVLSFTLMTGEEINVYLYLRKGKHRLTRTKIELCIDAALSLCWQLSLLLAPTTTEQQPEKISKPIPKPETKSALNKTLSKTPTTDDQTSTISSKATTEEQTNVQPNLSIETSDASFSDNINKGNVQTSSHAKTDAELVDALEKLVKLKEQNYLTEQEFQQAKTKLLKQLI